MEKLERTFFNRRPMQDLVFERSARRNVLVYLMLVFGALFLYAGLTVDPSRNCEGSHCAPWLVPLAAAIGGFAVLGAIAALVRNPRSGSRVDHDTRTLSWWSTYPLVEPKSISLDSIHKIRIETIIENERITFLGRDEKPIPLFPLDGAIPLPREHWARSLVSRYPHIALEVID